MMIQVVLKKGIRDTVPDYLLGMMIAAGEVISLQRSAGWVKIGVDPVRKGVRFLLFWSREKEAESADAMCFLP